MLKFSIFGGAEFSFFGREVFVITVYATALITRMLKSASTVCVRKNQIPPSSHFYTLRILGASIARFCLFLKIPITPSEERNESVFSFRSSDGENKRV